jgi:outer membrane receptor protein involved in Fe transport
VVSRALILFVTGALPVLAQFSSSIQGLVSDVSGGVIPAAAITVTNVATGVSRETATSANGFYRVLDLGPGQYRVAASKAGFQNAEQDKIDVGISDAARVDFVLNVGAVGEKVTVTANVVQVETEQGRVSGRIEAQQLRDLPLNGRNLYNLLAVQPGVAGRGLATTFGASGGGTNNDSFAAENGPQIYASGQRTESNSFTVDDTSVNSAARGGVANLTPNADSVAEVRVVSNNFSAVDGRNSGAQIQVVTKSGTNEFHGGASYYFENNTLADRNEFEAAVPVFRRNEFDYYIGGPIVRNRAFFFTSYDGVRQSGSRASLVTVETPAFRDFVVRTRPNSIAAKLLGGFQPAVDPTLNFRDLGSPARGVNLIGPADGILDIGSAVFAPLSYRNGNQFTVRIDHELRPSKDKLYGNFYRTLNDTLNGGIRPGFNRPGHEYGTYVSLNETHIFDAGKLNEFRAGMARVVGLSDAPPHLEIPLVNINAATGFSTASYPSGYYQTNFDYKDTFSWIRSAHTLRLGAEVRRVRADSHNTTNFIPAYTFANILDFADDEPLQMIRKVDPRTGDPAVNVVGLRNYEWALFLNDDWKVTPKLTLNLGLRYENYRSPYEVNNLLRNLLYGDGSSFSDRLATGKVDIVQHFFPPANKGFAPRFGFAWNPDGRGRTAVRGGYGIAYDRLFMTPLLDFRDSPPLRADVTLGTQFGTAFTYTLGDVSKPGLGYVVDPSLRLGLDAHNGLKGVRASLRAIDPHMPTAYAHNWFLGVQRLLGFGVVVEADYLGSAGHHLYNQANVNRYAGDLLDNRFDGFNSSFAAVNLISATADSIYHGGSLQVRRQFANGFTVQASYTFSRAIDVSDDLTNASNYQNVWNRRADRALAGFDATHKLSIIGLWDLPFFRSRHGFVQRAFGGWQLGGFSIFQSGNPLSVTTSAAYPRGDFNADGTSGDRPNAPPSGTKTSGFSRAEFLQGVFPATIFPLPSLGTGGNLGRNTFRGPSFAQVDMSLSKKVAVTERISVQFRAEAFNTFNHVNLNNPTLDLSSNNFGKSTSALIPRQFQLGLKVQF